MDVLQFFCRSREAKQRLEQRRLRLYRVAYSWCHSSALAEDLVQDTLTKAMQKSSQLRDPKAGDAWLFSILTNCYRDHFRRRKQTESIENIELVEETTPETESTRHQVVEQVQMAIRRLPEGQRQTLTLVDLEGFSYVEVANILDIPIGTVMSRLCRARRALRDQILKDNLNLIDQSTTDKESQIRRIK